MRKSSAEWNTYRTRFLVKAKQLHQPFAFIDALGREHCGQAGDYLVESSDGTRRIAQRQIFEDIYVSMPPEHMAPLLPPSDAVRRKLPQPCRDRRASSGRMSLM